MTRRLPRPKLSIGLLAFAPVALIVLSATVGGDVEAQSLSADPLAAHLLGEWSGEGVYEGNRLKLTRSWTLELGSQFLRADMGVSMPNGATFGALMYWKQSEPSSYDIMWLDGIGRMQSLRAESDSDSGIVGAEFVDDLAEGGPEERRWEYERTGPDSYVERLLRRTSDGWGLLTEWRFTRDVRAPARHP